MSTVLRYTLNGTILTDEPLGWLDTSETIRREETFFSLINEVQGQIQFVKQGSASTESYNIITTAIAVNPCQRLTFLVERQNTSGIFEEEFDGLLPLTGITENEINSFYNGDIVINDLGATIQNNLSSLYFFTQTRSLDGSVTVANNAYTNRKTSTLRDPTDISVTVSRTLFRIKDVLQGMLDFITNNGITLDSDLFETDGHQEVIRFIDYDNLTAGDTIDVTFTFFSGVSGVFTHTFVDLITLTAAFRIFGRTAHGSGEQDYLQDRQGDTHYLEVDLDAGNQIYTFTSVNNFTIDSATVTGTGTVTAITTTQEATYGMVNLMYSTGNNLSLSTGSSSLIPPSISLKDFIAALNKNLYISFRIIKSGGTQTFKLERFEDFFESTSSLTVNRVQNLSRQLISDFNKSTLDVGDAHDATYQDEVHEPSAYASQDCVNDSLDIVTSFFTDSKTVYEVADTTNTTNNGLQDHFFVHTEDASLFPPVTESPRYQLIIPDAYHPINAWLTNMQRIRGNLFQLADNIGSSASTSLDIKITNTKARNFLYRTTFDVEISYANFQSMKDGQAEKILFNSDGLTNSEGWIQEVDYNKKTGLAKFILLTE